MAKENADVMVDLYISQKDHIRERLAATSYTLPKFVSAECILVSAEELPTKTSGSVPADCPVTELSLILQENSNSHSKITSIGNRDVTFMLSESQLEMMILELSKAEATMRDL